MEVYFISKTTSQEELDNIYVQILNDYNVYNTVSMIFKQKNNNINLN